MVTFTSAVKSFYSKYADFSGRASRSQYWWVQLYMILSYSVLYGIILSMIGSSYENYTLGTYIMFAITVAFSLLNILPMIALSVRRLHDSGHGGQWYFMQLVPCVGSIWFFILMLWASEDENRFGEPTDYTESE